MIIRLTKYRILAIAIVIIFLMIAVASCSPLATVEPTQQTPIAVKATNEIPSVTPTQAASVTSTVPPSVTPTPLPTLTPTATPFQIPAEEQRCWRIIEGIPPTLNGRLVLSGFRRTSPSSLLEGVSYLLDLETGEQIPLGRTQFETVSPDGNWLAFYDVDLEIVVIADHNGDRLIEFPSPDSQLTPGYWLDNQRLMLNNRLDNPSRADNASLIILDPFTKEQQEWLPEYPKQDHENYYHWKLESYLVFNPALSHVVYPLDVNGHAIVLWDVQSQRAVVHIYGGSIPRWSSQGTHFITSANLFYWNGQETFININDGLPYEDGSELLLVNLDGEVKRLTYLTTSRWVVEDGYVWSPDGQQIAFYLQEPLNFSPPELAVVDVATGAVTNYCETVKLPLSVQNLPIFPPDLVWSSDENYLAITQLDKQFQHKVFLVELASGKAWQIAEDVSAMGWMVSSP